MLSLRRELSAARLGRTFPRRFGRLSSWYLPFGSRCRPLNSLPSPPWSARSAPKRLGYRTGISWPRLRNAAWYWSTCKSLYHSPQSSAWPERPLSPSLGSWCWSGRLTPGSCSGSRCAGLSPAFLSCLSNYSRSQQKQVRMRTKTIILKYPNDPCLTYSCSLTNLLAW